MPRRDRLERQADEVLANDLDRLGRVHGQSRLDRRRQPFDVQAVVGGKWHGDRASSSSSPARCATSRRAAPILSREYRGAARTGASLVHRFADDVVLQFTGELGVAETRIAFVAQNGREKELCVDGRRWRRLSRAHRAITRSRSRRPGRPMARCCCSRRIAAAPGRRSSSRRPRAARPISSPARPGNNTSAVLLARRPRDRVHAQPGRQSGDLPARRARRIAAAADTRQPRIDTSPAWSPTGREIAFTSDRGGSPQVYVMDRDGGNVRRLTYDCRYTDSPAWSPRGDRLAFVSQVLGRVRPLCLQGRRLRRAAGRAGGSNENPHWSPDGRHLVFASNREGPFALFITDLDDRPPRKLDTGGRVALSPAWSPRLNAAAAVESAEIAAHSTRGASHEEDDLPTCLSIAVLLGTGA